MARWDITQGFAQAMPWSPSHGFGNAGIIQYSPMQTNGADKTRADQAEARKQAAHEKTVQGLYRNFSDNPTAMVEFQPENDKLTDAQIANLREMNMSDYRDINKNAGHIATNSSLEAQRQNLAKKDKLLNANIQTSKKTIEANRDIYDNDKHNLVLAENLANKDHDPNNPDSSPYKSYKDIHPDMPQAALADPRVLNPHGVLARMLKDPSLVSQTNKVTKKGDYGHTVTTANNQKYIAGFHKLDENGALVIDSEGNAEAEVSPQLFKAAAAQWPNFRASIDEKLKEQGLDINQVPVEQRDEVRRDFMTDNANNKGFSATQKQLNNYKETSNQRVNSSYGWGEGLKVAVGDATLYSSKHPKDENRHYYASAGTLNFNKYDGSPIKTQLSVKRLIDTNGKEEAFKEEKMLPVQVNNITGLIGSPSGEKYISFGKNIKESDIATHFAQAVVNGEIKGYSPDNIRQTLKIIPSLEVNILDKNNVTGDVANEQPETWDPTTRKMVKNPNFSKTTFIPMTKGLEGQLYGLEVNPNDPRFVKGQIEPFKEKIFSEVDRLNKAKKANGAKAPIQQKSTKLVGENNVLGF